MRSPSSFRRIRTVPCVAGCDGPILSSIGSKGRSRVSSAGSGALVSGATDAGAPCVSVWGSCSDIVRSLNAGRSRRARSLPEVVVHRVAVHGARADDRLAALLRVVLPQRVSLELLVEVDALQAGVPVEPDPVEVPGLALEPVRARPDVDDA